MESARKNLKRSLRKRPRARGAIVCADRQQLCATIVGKCRSKRRCESPKCSLLGSVSNDPLGFAAGDSNLYRYVGNGPTNSTDPTGLEEVYLLHDTSPDSASSILNDRFSSQRGFISFKDTKSKDHGMRASRHTSQTARIAVQLDVSNATDITRVLRKEISHAAKIKFALRYPGQDFRSPAGNKAYTAIKFELLHEYISSQEGNVFRQKTGGGYHYFVRESGTAVSGRVVGVSGYGFASQDLGGSTLGKQLVPRNNISSRVGRSLVRALPSDSAISGAGSTAPMALWIVGSEVRYHTLGSDVTGGEYAHGALLAETMLNPLLYAIDVTSSGVVPLNNGMDAYDREVRQDQNSFIDFTLNGRQTFGRSASSRDIRVSRGYMQSQAVKFMMNGMPGLSEPQQRLFLQELEGDKGDRRADPEYLYWKYLR